LPGPFATISVAGAALTVSASQEPQAEGDANHRATEGSRAIERQSQPDLFPIAIGTGRLVRDLSATQTSARQALERAISLGVTLIDVAPWLGDGLAEKVVGEVVEPARGRVRLLTKVAPGDDPRESLLGSLDRLQTGYVDYLHLSEIPGTPGALERAIEAMATLQEEGLALAIGLAGANGADLHRAAQVAPISSCELPLNIFERDVVADALPAAMELRLEVFARRPLAFGLLTGSGSDAHLTAEDDHRGRHFGLKGREAERRTRVRERLRELAADRGMTLGQLALAWVLSRPAVTSAVVGVRSAEEIAEYAGVESLALDTETFTRIDEAIDAVYVPRLLRDEIRVVATDDRGVDVAIVAGGGDDRRVLSAGAREAYIMRHLDGRTSYREIADGWEHESGHRMLMAQLLAFVDQLDDLALLESAPGEVTSGS
jgi:aryl-alcohol dehydrogenase-like predicted oxidoreductase